MIHAANVIIFCLGKWLITYLIFIQDWVSFIRSIIMITVMFTRYKVLSYRFHNRKKQFCFPYSEIVYHVNIFIFPNTICFVERLRFRMSQFRDFAPSINSQ